MAKYRKADNCGPVPHPDRSGKFLNAGEVAEGDHWEPLLALGYVVKVDEKPTEVVTTVASVAVTPKAAPSPPKAPEPKADIVKEEAQGVTDVMQTNDRAGAEEMDSSAPGQSGDEGLSGRAPSRRRR